LNPRNISIVLGAYNGSDYLRDQLESILGQSHKNWELVVRDDASSDSTLAILHQYASRDSRIVVLKDDLGNQGVIGNFNCLIEKAMASSSNYFAFSDQDDLWCPDKLSTQLALIRTMEEKYPGQPVLVHSDMEVVDASLASLSPSFMAYQGIFHQVFDPLNVLLVQNFVTGCTMVMNRKLLEIAYPVPRQALMHDWWIALCAAVFGRIEFIDKPLMKYRQHSNNQVGAKPLSKILNPFFYNWYQLWHSGRLHLIQSVLQAQSLYDRILNHDPDNTYLDTVRAYGSILDMTAIKRLKLLYNHAIAPQSNIRKCLTVSRLFFISRKGGE
jgi:rhamnosyltransferase